MPTIIEQAKNNFLNDSFSWGMMQGMTAASRTFVRHLAEIKLHERSTSNRHENSENKY
jgi:hypothetical protein